MSWFGNKELRRITLQIRIDALEKDLIVAKDPLEFETCRLKIEYVKQQLKELEEVKTSE